MGRNLGRGSTGGMAERLSVPEDQAAWRSVRPILTSNRCFLEISEPVSKERNTANRLGFYLDGIGYSIRLFRLAFDRLEAAVSKIESESNSDDEHNDLVFSAILDAWALVDTSHRIRELIQQIPGWRKKMPFAREFVARTELVDSFRNYIQHLRHEIPDRADRAPPVWGTISWKSKNTPLRSHSIFTGNILPGVEVHTLTFDRVAMEFTSELTLEGTSGVLKLDDLNRRVLAFRTGLREWATSQANVTRATGRIPVMKFEIVCDNEEESVSESS